MKNNNFWDSIAEYIKIKHFIALILFVIVLLILSLKKLLQYFT
ncbi:hypothetical protein C7H62_1862 [Mesoflavibacter sp. HG96]|nr:hypothetical protein C7H62_1862 [Mesoflavibacter sp. HG96]QIJ92399.1 hypothetical protein C7H56_1862 [Mesoflavibacter sp. HG37]